MSRDNDVNFRVLILLLFLTLLLVQDTDQKKKKKKPKKWPTTTVRPMRVASRPTIRPAPKWGEYRETFIDFFNLYTYDLPPLNRPSDCADCPHVYIPVCSNMNITFTNECYMHCANFTAWNLKLEKKRMGLCYPFEPPEREDAPVSEINIE